uniref:Large ribosomal subunit protein bL34m n=1 Tax=Aureoumbra lagunensis TaxID=44058 RepID=A0A7S3NIP4_9STRA|mmetsp:Transcript_23323/g.30244  ORF Transcript_23323/g.30244 Transcript_23323/m.30244 type:complete len:160 (+) Transcript_23323:58-537(+)
MMVLRNTGIRLSGRMFLRKSARLPRSSLSVWFSGESYPPLMPNRNENTLEFPSLNESNQPFKGPGEIIDGWTSSTGISDQELFYNRVFMPHFFPIPDTNDTVKNNINSEPITKQAIKRTFQPSIIRRKRKHGFLSRINSKKGRKIINRRKNKGRWRISA